MWDKPFDEGTLEKLPVEIDEDEDLPKIDVDDEDLAFSEEFFNKFCEIKHDWKDLYRID